MKKTILILMGMIAVFLGFKGKQEPAQPVVAEEGQITGLRFEYDMFSGDMFYLNAFVENMTADGAKVTLEKRIGPMNYTGHRKEGELSINGEQAGRLREILDRYDLAAWSKLPSAGSGSAPSRSLIVFSGKEKLYDVKWNVKFPKTLPPQEDILYCELFNFFNDLISREPGWEDVRSENLEDPRDNPAYSERRVSWFGHEVRLVPGTGTWHEDGRYADIDYEGKDWWVEEGFVGQWSLDAEEPTGGLNAPDDASLTVLSDGSARLVVDGEEWPGRVAAVRRYRDSVGLNLEKDYERRLCTVESAYEESYERIHVVCYPGPVPEPQFAPIDVYLLKNEPVDNKGLQ